MDTAESVDQLVVIGSSAGGIEALPILVSTLSADFPAPIILAQHLHPERVSHLEQILQRSSRLPVRTIVDRHQLEKGVIFVVPPNTSVEITNHEVTVVKQPTGRPMPSVDRLFSTAAAVFNENLIAVILTGSGSDGAAGAREVKAAGGTVVIENPETSRFSGMPAALASTTVDIIANLESIGPLLNELITGNYLITTPAADESELNRLLGDLRERNGIDFASYKPQTIRRRLQRRLAATNMVDLAEYRRYLKDNPDEVERLISSFLIKVTEFFRDPELFDYFLEGGLQAVLDEARERAVLRIWCAGCATGEEAYSMAILISELLGEDFPRVNVRIFGTDLDADAIVFARRGLYPAAALAEMPREYVKRYFIEHDDVYEVKQTIRSLVIFGEHDLGQRSPFPRIDLMLCRNVLIYFTPELQRRALQLFAFALRRNGLLILGKAESVDLLSEYFTLEHAQLKVYRRIGDAVLIPPTTINSIAPATLEVGLRQETSLKATRVDLHDHQLYATAAVRLGRLDGILADLPEGVVVVDRNYVIQTINSAARRHLGIHRAAMDHDLIHLVQHIPLTRLRNAIDAAFDHETSAEVFSLEGMMTEMGELRYLEMRCLPVVEERQLDLVVSVVVHTVDVSRLESLHHDLDDATRRIEQLSGERRRLETANEELVDVNTYLRAMNEELQISNEEFQAAAEEVETLNEELQATNEELETLNEELQATIEELNTTNDELQARTLELHELVQDREAQRRKSEAERILLEDELRATNAVLASMSVAFAVINEHGETILANDAFQATFDAAGELLDAVGKQGRPVIEENIPQFLAAQREPFEIQFEFRMADGTRHRFKAVGQPVEQEDGPRCSVVAIRDITAER